MQVLAEVSDGQFGPHLLPLVTAYEEWISAQEQRLANPTPDLQPYRVPGQHDLVACRTALERIRAGITLLDTNPDAAAAFRFANRAMAQQRVRGLYAAAVRHDHPPLTCAISTRACMTKHSMPMANCWRSTTIPMPKCAMP